MRIIVTGAGGFVGRKLVEQLTDHDIVALDHVADGIPKLAHVTPVTGDLCNVNILQAAMADGCDAVVHRYQTAEMCDLHGAARYNIHSNWEGQEIYTIASLAVIHSGPCARVGAVMPG